MKWNIGCSGFHYADWKEVFYPKGIPQREWFAYYSSIFDTLELNVTFYRFPQPKFLENWYQVSPSHFSFSVKAPRLITHYKQFKECKRLLRDFYTTTIDGLKEKLGTVLFQLPPAWQFRRERLELLCELLWPGVKNVVEFRHASWWDKKIYNRLKKQGIIFSGSSHPTLPGEPVINNRIVYYRFHGVPKMFYSAYTHKQLREITDKLTAHPSVKEAFIYFNNTATPAAIRNALWLKKYTQSLITPNT